jgi:hypothetical protein
MNQKIKEQQEFKETKNIEIEIPKWEALGHHSIKEYQGWCYFNDVESQSYNPDITSEELDKLCILYDVETKKKNKKNKKSDKYEVSEFNDFDMEEIIKEYGKL